MELYTNIQKLVDLCYVSLAQVELSVSKLPSLHSSWLS